MAKKGYDPHSEAFARNDREVQGLKALLRDRGKIEEILNKFINCLIIWGGTVGHLFDLLSPSDGDPHRATIFNIADAVMGGSKIVPREPLEILTTTGKSDYMCSVAAGKIQEADLPWQLLLDPAFSKPDTRMVMAKVITDQAKLKEIALHGGRSDGWIATGKLTSLDDLFEVAIGSNYNTTAFAALDRLPQVYLERVVDQSDDGERRYAAVARMTDREKLTQIYGSLPPHHDSHHLGRAASERIKELDEENQVS